MLNRRTCLKWAAASSGVLALGKAGGTEREGKPVRLGFIGLGWRGGELINAFLAEPGVEATWLCDADRSRIEAIAKVAPQAKKSQNLQEVIDSDDVDAVVIATCNHWHCLAAVRAIAAGKDVYVEKPLGHNVWEGRQVVAAARKYGRIVQLGTQQRSDPMQAEVRQFLHEDQALGKVLGVEVCRYGVRQSIGRTTEPLVPPATVDMNLWTGPAADEPIYRPNLHYDWHWSWNTGCGEMGNWGVHLVDDVLGNVLLDRLPAPHSVQGGGARLVWNDAGETPNVHFVRFDAGKFPVVIGLSNLPAAPGQKASPRRHGVESGYIVTCEGGEYHGWRAGGVAIDAAGHEMRKFQGTGGMKEHVGNFLYAVRTQDRSVLNAEIAIGDASTNWCHLANIAFRTGTPGGAGLLNPADKEWLGMLGGMAEHLGNYDLKLSDQQIHADGRLDVSMTPAGIKFTGDNADAANGYVQREYRRRFEFPAV